jgi:hypothetical protein
MGNPVPSHAGYFCSVGLQVALLSSVLVRDLAKSAKHMLVVKFTDLEIGSAAERYGTSVAKYLPKPSRTLYRSGRARAVNGFASRDATISEIEGQSHERNDLCHRLRTAVTNRPVLPLLPASARKPSTQGSEFYVGELPGIHLLI